MELETDADRLDTLRALGGSLVRIDGQKIFALYESESEDVGFEDSSVRSARHTLQLLTSDVSKYGIKQGFHVEITDVGSFKISAPPSDEAGMTTLSLVR